MWLYNNSEFLSKDIPKNCIGFVYCITNLLTDKKYIGKKNFFSTIRKPPLKGKKNKRKIITESDWKEYFGSNRELQEIVAQHPIENFSREILHLCYSKGELNYMELKEQIERDVLYKPNEYYNSFIGIKISRSHLI